MDCTRTEQGDFLGEWKCPECGVKDGIEVCELTPVYFPATPTFQDGQWIAKYDEAHSADIFWEGSEPPIIYCLNCRANLSMEVDY